MSNSINALMGLPVEETVIERKQEVAPDCGSIIRGPLNSVSRDARTLVVMAEKDERMGNARVGELQAMLNSIRNL